MISLANGRITVRCVMRGILAGLAIVSLVTCARPPERTRQLVEFVAALDRAEPIYPAALAGLFGWKPRCTAPADNGRVDCDAHDFDVAEVKIGHMDFRSGKFGSLLILEPLEGDCLAVGAFDQRFGQGTDSSFCTHGVSCIGRLYRRTWGGLILDLGRDSSATICVKSVTLNTDRVWRLTNIPHSSQGAPIGSGSGAAIGTSDGAAAIRP
jgi:hypothetical protein